MASPAHNQIRTIDRVINNVEPIGATLQDNTGTAVNLTGKTVTFTMINMADGTVVVNAEAATIVTAASGTVSFTPDSTDVDTVGVYAMYFDDSDGRRYPYDGARFRLNIIAATTPAA